MSLNKLFELLNIIRGKHKKDLKVFVKMSSNHLSLREEEIIIALLESDLDEKAFNKNYLKDSERPSWNKMKNRFVNVLERYLMIEIIEESYLSKDLELVSFFSRYGLNKNYKIKINKIKYQLLKGTKIDETKSYKELRLHEIEVEDSRQKDIRKRSSHLKNMNEALDSYYFENKLRLACEQFNRATILNEQMHEFKFLEYFKSKKIANSSIGIQIHYNTLKMLISEKETYLTKLLELMSDYENNFSPDYVKSIYIYVLNHCSKMINKGNIKFATAYIQVINAQVKKDLLIEDDYINPNRFKNCITISLLAKDLDWAISFWTTYKDKLPTKYRESVQRFNMAKILFHQGKYKKCHDELIQFQPIDMYYKIAYEKMILKIYYYQYQQKKFDKEKLRAKINSVKKYIGIQIDLNKERKIQISKYLKCMLKLINKQKIEISKLKGKIPTVDFVWLKKEVTQ